MLIAGPNLIKSMSKFQATLYLEKNEAGERNIFRNQQVDYVYLANNVQALVQKVVSTATRQEIVRILHKYLDSAAKVSGRLAMGFLKKEFTVDSWRALADQIVYELRSEQNYFIEIDLAEVVICSSNVSKSFDKAIPQLRECLANILHLLKGLGVDISPYTTIFKTIDIEKKHYRWYVPGLQSESLWDASMKDDLNLEQKIAVAHDLLQLAWDMIKIVVENEVYSEHFRMSLGKHPLSAKTKTQTGTVTGKEYLFFGKVQTRAVFKERTDAVDELAIAYAKSQGWPSEMGPSYTTVRFANINTLLKAVQGASKIPLNFELLDKDTVTFLIWGIFAYWTLYYHKTISGAHTFFEINEAATQLGYPLSPSQKYPKLDEVERMLGVKASDSHLKSVSRRLRRRAVLLGLDQSIIAGQGELLWTDDAYHVRRERFDYKVQSQGAWHEPPKAPESLQELIESGVGGS